MPVRGLVFVTLGFMPALPITSFFDRLFLHAPGAAQPASGSAQRRLHHGLSRAARLASLVAVALALGSEAATAADTFSVASFTPQGEVARVRQITARFSVNMVAFGDPKAAAPFTVSCDDASASKGQGRWISAREWVYDFDAARPPGVRCQAHLVSGTQSASGADLKGTSSYLFNTGGRLFNICVRALVASLKKNKSL